METQSSDIHQKRPDLLTVLCILTFTISGLFTLGGLLYYFTYESLIELYGSIEKYKEVADALAMFSKNYFLWNFLLNPLSIAGAVLMWNFKKIGFHLYTVSKIVLILIYTVYFPQAGFPLLLFLISLIFVLLYYKNNKYMQ